MLKTNSKKAMENIRAYIADNTTTDGRGLEKEPETFPEIAAFILGEFRKEKYWCIQDFRYYGGSEQNAFLDWAAGLPSVLDTCYYWNRSAVNELAAILEESESEKARYTESQAERMLTVLIYRELLKGEKENVHKKN